MAETSVDITTAQRIDWALDYLAGRWAEIPEVAAEWDGMDPVLEKEPYQLEWAVPRSHLRRLEAWVAAGCLDSGQRRRYEDLFALIEANAPILARLFAS